LFRSASVVYTKIIPGPFAGAYTMLSVGPTIRWDNDANVGDVYGRAVGDLDSDGAVDYATQLADGTQAIRWGPLAAESPHGDMSVIGSAEDIELLRVNPAGDVTGDGRPDLLALGALDSGDYRLMITTGPFTREPSPDFADTGLWVPIPDRLVRYARVRDLDGDGL